GGEHRALDQSDEIVGRVERLIEHVEIGGDGVDCALLEGKLEQGRRITAGHAGNAICLCCHLKRLFLPNGRSDRSGHVPRTREMLGLVLPAATGWNPVAWSPRSPRSLYHMG